MTPEQVLRRLTETTRVCYDAETSGLDFRNNHIVGHVLCFGPAPDDSVYIPVRHAAGGNIVGCSVPDRNTGWGGDVHPFESELVQLLERPELRVLGHNLAFDLKFLSRIGMRRFDAQFEDTQINAVLINEWEKSFSLDHQCRVNGVAQKKVGIYDYMSAKFGVKNDKNTMGHFWRLAGDDPQAVEYAASDGTATWQLWNKQLVEIELQNLQVVHEIECKVIPVLARMVAHGIRIDEARLHEVKGIVEGKRAEALRSLPEGFNSRAPSQVRGLMEQNGHTDWPMTVPTKAFSKGQPSFSEQWLLTNEVGQRIVKVRKCENLLASFIEPMIDTHLWKGRVHPDYNQLRGDEYGTITGRLSSSNPNLQQVSKRNRELGELHRSIFVPDEGMVWGSADYQQIEPKLLAFYTRCKVLMDGYNASPPIDAHMSVATAAGIDREKGKRVNQTLLTGGGKKVLTVRYGIPPDEADQIWDRYFEVMPEIKSFQRQAAQRMRNRGYVMSLLGRRARMNDKDYVALNRLLQCGNADCLKQKMVEIDAFLRSEGEAVSLLNNVHDSLDFQFAPEHERIYREALQIMTSFGPDDLIKLDVPITVDSKEGRNWAEATWG